MNKDRNPYMDSTLRELWQACQDRAGELLHPPDGPRTPEQRQALAFDTAHLLLALGSEIATGEFLPSAPEKDMRGQGAHVADVFMRHHEHAAIGVRYRTLMHAVDFVLGGARRDWVKNALVDGHRAYDLALSSDEGLRVVLVALDQLRKAKA